MKTGNRQFDLPKKARNLTGLRFGRLVALESVGEAKKGHVLWKCKCDCGKEVVVVGCNLTSGHTRSCGCLQREKAASMMTKHGMTGSSEYKTWNAMLQRCENPNHKSFSYYGGRGVKVCERWHKFENFYADMGKKPEGKSIDRIENNGYYELGNCRWATFHEQQLNRRSNSTGPTKQRPFFAFNFKNAIVYSSNSQRQFARGHGLSRGNISLCLHNQRPTHKGWTFSYCPEG